MTLNPSYISLYSKSLLYIFILLSPYYNFDKAMFTFSKYRRRHSCKCFKKTVFFSAIKVSTNNKLFFFSFDKMKYSILILMFVLYWALLVLFLCIAVWWPWYQPQPQCWYSCYTICWMFSHKWWCIRVERLLFVSKLLRVRY